MGLPERRMVEELQEVTLRARQKEIAEICGRDIPVEVDWATLEDDADPLRFIDHVSFHRLNRVLRMICADKIGKDALSRSLHKIRLVNVADKAAMGIEFAGGTLEIRCAHAMGTSGMHSDATIRRVLQNGL